MEDLKRRVLRLVRRHFPGCKIEWLKSPRRDVISGSVVWAGFLDMEPLDRQDALGDVLDQLSPEDQPRVSTMLACTPEEAVAMELNAKESW